MIVNVWNCIIPKLHIPHNSTIVISCFSNPPVFQKCNTCVNKISLSSSSSSVLWIHVHIFLGKESFLFLIHANTLSKFSKGMSWYFHIPLTNVIFPIRFSICGSFSNDFLSKKSKRFLVLCKHHIVSTVSSCYPWKKSDDVDGISRRSTKMANNNGIDGFFHSLK